MRTLLILLLLSTPAIAQDATTTLPEAAEIVSELQAKVAKLEAENRELRAQLRAMPAKEPTPAASRFKLTIVTKEGCPACPIAKRYHPPRYQAAGWLTGERDEGRGRPGFSYPYYEICTDNLCYPPIQCGVYELDAKVREWIARYQIQSLLERRAR